MRTVFLLIGVPQAAVVAAVSQSPLVAAIVGGVFLIVNSLLTYFLTGARYERRAPRRPRPKRKRQGRP